MPIKLAKAVRVFQYSGVRIPDPNPTLAVPEIKTILALAHPEIATAEISGPIARDGLLVYNIERAVGSKG